MSHFFCLMLTPGVPTPSEVEAKLQPFERKQWDWWVLGGRWRGELLLKPGVELEDSRAMFDSLDRIASERGDPVRTVPGVSQVLKRDLDRLSMMPYAVLDLDGNWNTLGRLGWFGITQNNVTEEEWTTQVTALIESLSDDVCLTIIDCHI